MCNAACLQFAENTLSEPDLEGKNVLEVGSLNVNGSVRRLVTSCRPSRYLGVDVVSGPGVDEICDIQELTRRYGRDRYDVVICTEVLEHVKKWRAAISNLKNVLKEGGLVLITTRSQGFPHHGYPDDFWRYDVADLRIIFSDFFIEHLTPDPSSPGVFLKARKNAPFREGSLDSHKLYSVVTNSRCRDINNVDVIFFKVRKHVRSKMSLYLPSSFKALIRQISNRVAKS
jgi:SAM-dependent methyltransferase